MSAIRKLNRKIAGWQSIDHITFRSGNWKQEADKLGDCEDVLEYLATITSSDADGPRLIGLREVLCNLTLAARQELDIYFKFMFYEYPQDGTLEDAIEGRWFDTIYIFSKDPKLLKHLEKIFVKIREDPTKDEGWFDEIDIYDLKGRKYLRLWID